MASKGRSKIFPFLWYAKEAEQAAKFYASIFPDSRVDRVTPMLSEVSAVTGPARHGRCAPRTPGSAGVGRGGLAIAQIE